MPVESGAVADHHALGNLLALAPPSPDTMERRWWLCVAERLRGASHSREGVPVNDRWSVEGRWRPDFGRWSLDGLGQGESRQRSFHFHVSVPARSRQHEQAAVYTLWSPGTPPVPRDELVQFYGFRKKPSGWECTAESEGGAAHYERVAEALSGTGSPRES